ncbi:YoaK family protein [Pseudomonas sp. TWP3-1]|uniref:YoaK family protein n=1 Tax=unclassified Pseudomonas TaxID=196821 RepID=UPI003CF1DE0E
MPIKYVRSLTGRRRTPDANRHLGLALAFVAGAINAGGFLAVNQYTSHMTGIVSAMADNSVLGAYGLVLSGAGALLSFIAGAACSAVMVNYSRRRRMHSEFALPLLFEAVLLIAFGFLGARLSTVDGLFVSVTVMLLCFIMGLQNAVITKISRAEIRTTHVTGIITDIGIELGKLVYRNAVDTSGQPKVLADRARLKILILLALNFFAGGMAGAFGFNYIGYIATIPLAMVLLTLAIVPVLDDVIRFVRRAMRR